MPKRCGSFPYLENFVPMPSQYVPGTGILREFIGGAEFKY
jgi:uridine kinase